MRSPKRAFALIPALAFSAVLAGQRPLVDLTGPDFLHKSNLIFVGKVLRQASDWTEDGRFIVTRYTFEVEQNIKGANAPVLDIVEYGGTVGDRSMSVSESPRYRQGRSYLVFTKLDSRSRMRTLAGAFGQFPVTQDAQGRRLVRIYRQHPLSEVIGVQTFHEVTTLAQRIQASLSDDTQAGKN